MTNPEEETFTVKELEHKKKLDALHAAITRLQQVGESPLVVEPLRAIQQEYLGAVPSMSDSEKKNIVEKLMRVYANPKKDDKQSNQ